MVDIYLTRLYHCINKYERGQWIWRTKL